VAEDDQTEPVDAPDPTEAPEMLGHIDMSPEDLKAWWGRIDASRALRKKASKWWESNLKAYAPSIDDSCDHYETEVNTNRDFTLVERKKADLFYQQPEVTLEPSPLMAGQEPLIEAHQHIVNELLGADGANVKPVAHQVLFDVLCTAGTGFTKIGYEQSGVMQEVADPQTGELVQVEVPVFSQIYWRHISPKQALIPADHTSTIWDDAPWLGWEGEMPLRVAKRKGWVPEDFEGSSPDKDLHFGESRGDVKDSVVKFVEIYYKSALYRDDRVHPQHLTHLVLVDGKTSKGELVEPAVHEDSPDQQFDDRGRLTKDSLIGFPIHPLTIRTVTDSPIVPSDCTISRPLVAELNRFREDMIRQRDANNMRWLANNDTLPPDALQKIVRSPIGGIIPIPGEAFVGDGAIKELPHGSYPRENFTFNDYLDNDLARTHAIDESQSGADASGSGTATEAQITQNNSNARLGFERGIVLDWYLKGVTKFSTLIQRYLDVEKAAEIIGPEPTQAWDQWRRSVPSALAFTALPDSTMRQDSAVARKQAMDVYSFLRRDEMVNPIPLLTNVARRFHLSAQVVAQNPPQKGPEPTKPGFSFKGDDLNPLNPQFPIVIEILRMAGVNVTPEAVKEAQGGALNQMMAQQAVPTGDVGAGQPGASTGHGGKQPQQESLSKHHAEMTGGMQGTGAPAPMAPGGLM
jgi:hypothetical protein